MNLQSLFYPQGVAVVGSTSEGKIGYELIRQILEGGYREVYAVNPKGQGASSENWPSGGYGRRRIAYADSARRAGGLRPGRR